MGAVLEWLFPQQCYLCSTPSTLALCPDCIAALPYQQHACPLCGRAMRVSRVCHYCRINPPRFKRSYAVFRYLDPIDKLIRAAKYQHDFRVLSLLAELMRTHFDQQSMILPEVFIPVPLHPLRQWARGYNQSYLLAKTLAQTFQLPVDYRNCRRVKNTAPQAQLPTREARYQNIYEAFTYHPPYPAWKHIALVDDVYTTGSTLNEITRILLAGGAQRVDVWCCARR